MKATYVTFGHVCLVMVKLPIHTTIEKGMGDHDFMTLTKKEAVELRDALTKLLTVEYEVVEKP